MKYLVRTSVVHVIGTIWMPSVTCAQTYMLSNYDVENARDEAGTVTRESVRRWLDTHAGDFASITDFEASIEDGENTVDIPWTDEESELTFGDCMYPEED